MFPHSDPQCKRPSSPFLGHNENRNGQHTCYRYFWPFRFLFYIFRSLCLLLLHIIIIKR
jgi:hypothetical protein